MERCRDGHVVEKASEAGIASLLSFGLGYRMIQVWLVALRRPAVPLAIHAQAGIPV
jgi:hypothetical protein